MIFRYMPNAFPALSAVEAGAVGTRRDFVQEMLGSWAQIPSTEMDRGERNSMINDGLSFMTGESIAKYETESEPGWRNYLSVSCL